MRDILRRELRLWLVVAVIAAIYVVSQSPWMERRPVRDALGITAFHHVKILSKATDARSMTVTGSMIKRRCNKVGHTVYTLHDGVMRVAVFSTIEAPETPPNRPSSRMAQYFGPWVITARHDNPEAAAMFTVHRCPDGLQHNLVFLLNWD